ncbi:MAG: hypothetical protein P8J87_13975 [Verrucomicrobiales bacterium]|nr:hypothetical protein [Verrucomicrobiales bacterium]
MALNENKHGKLAACLLPLSLLIGSCALYIHFNVNIGADRETIFLALSVACPVLWLWGFFHLVRHYKLSVIWTLLGLLFVLGLAILIWAAGFQPRWEQQKIRRFAAKNSAPLVGPTPAQKAKSGKKAKVPPPRQN